MVKSGTLPLRIAVFSAEFILVDYLYSRFYFDLDFIGSRVLKTTCCG
jgi:hypothetical protein